MIARMKRKRLQFARMLTATTVLATSFTLPASHLWASSDGESPQTITATEENGRTVYVNESAPAKPKRAEAAEVSHRHLMYWSVKESRWKPVPGPSTQSMKAARSAAAEITQYFGRDSYQSANAKIISANYRDRTSRTDQYSSSRATPEDVESAIDMAAARHNVDPNLVRAVIKVESNFNPNAVSRKGAMGLMQLMPSTARLLKVKNPFDAEQNVDAGVRHLKSLLESYNGDVNLTLAAYNAGEGAVARSKGVPHIAETQAYVRRITNIYYGGLNIAPPESRSPLVVQRDARGVLYISNTE